MITVSILINGKAIFTRTAVNIEGRQSGIAKNQACTYKLDTGEIIKHKPIDGAVKLAKKMLDTIEEIK